MFSLCRRRERRASWCLFWLFSNLVCHNLLKKTTQSAVGPTYPKKKHSGPNAIIAFTEIPSTLALTDNLIDPSGLSRSEKFTSHGLKERLSLSLRGSRRCYRAAAWTGIFRGLTYIHTVHSCKPSHAHTPLHLGSTQSNERC